MDTQKSIRPPKDIYTNDTFLGVTPGQSYKALHGVGLYMTPFRSVLWTTPYSRIIPIPHANL